MFGFNHRDSNTKTRISYEPISQSGCNHEGNAGSYLSSCSARLGRYRLMLKDRIDLLITWTLTIVVAAVIFVIVHATRSHSTEK